MLNFRELYEQKQYGKLPGCTYTNTGWPKSDKVTFLDNSSIVRAKLFRGKLKAICGVRKDPHISGIPAVRRACSMNAVCLRGVLLLTSIPGFPDASVYMKLPASTSTNAAWTDANGDKRSPYSVL